MFHYAQTIFEGMKAYRHPDESIHMFRPEANAARFAKSARRLALPELVRRIPDLLLSGPDSDLEYRPLSLVYGLAALPVHRPSVLNV